MLLTLLFVILLAVGGKTEIINVDLLGSYDPNATIGGATDW